MVAGALRPVLCAFALLTGTTGAWASQPSRPLPSPHGLAAEITPSLAFQGARRLQLLCNITSDRGAADAELPTRTCNRVRALIASTGAPAPAIIQIGDPAVLAADAVTLLVHGHVQQLGDRRVLSFTMRPHRVSSEQTTVLFGTTPTAVDVTNSAAARLDNALRTAIANALPPTSRPNVGQPTP